MEAAVVRLGLGLKADPEATRRIDALRYGISLARVIAVRNPDGSDVDLMGPLDLFAREMVDLLQPRVIGARDLRQAFSVSDEVTLRATRLRASLLENMRLDRDALEREVTTRQLAIASGGGGGAGYVYPGAYDQIDRLGLAPSLMVGTSIGALMSMFRARRFRFDFAALVAAMRELTWTNIFEVFQSANQYGLPATLRLHLRRALGGLFDMGGRSMRLSETEIKLYVVTTGITVDALKHDLDYYEHFMDDIVRGPAAGVMRARGAIKVMSIAKEFLSRRDALREVVLGRVEGTEGFDVLDAAGFSASIPGVIHYDVLRDDTRMRGVLDALYADYGITRLGEGGMVSNVPARIAWESAVGGRVGPLRNVFVLALDCFAPNALTRPVWYPFQDLVRRANVDKDLKFADLYVPFNRTPSPLNLVPALPDAMDAIRAGREGIEPELPFLREMMRNIPVL